MANVLGMMLTCFALYFIFEELRFVALDGFKPLPRVFAACLLLLVLGRLFAGHRLTWVAVALFCVIDTLEVMRKPSTRERKGAVFLAAVSGLISSGVAVAIAW